MAKSKGPNFYAVAVGRVAGIYSSWGECKAQVGDLPYLHWPRPCGSASCDLNGFLTLNSFFSVE